ncbi:MAG: Mur ligase family protein [bacterium]
MKKINELFDVEEDFKIQSIHSDSRYVGKNSIFFCIDGFTTDGHKYTDDAIFQGAKVIVYSKPLKRRYPGILYIQVKDVTDELNRVVDIFYDYPSYKMTMIGVTGTAGKTMTSKMIQDVLSPFISLGYIGPNQVTYDDVISQSPYITPNQIFIHRNLSEMVKANVKGCAVEVSSLGLSLKRFDSIHFDIAVFTNIHSERMDFHGTAENLIMAYLKIFMMLDDKGYAVLNSDEVRFNHYLESRIRLLAKKITYGIYHPADVMADNIELYIDHTEFDLQLHNDSMHISVPILGEFNVYNILAVVSTLVALDMKKAQIIEAMHYLQPTEGRMEYLHHKENFHVIIDHCEYVKTYEDVFAFAQEVRGRGRVIALFGAPSKRHLSKREQIGELANQYCDLVILTQEDDNEDAEDICLEIQEYLTDIPSVIITDRRVAIYQAIELACDDDIILLLGKGSEQFMRTSVGNVPYPGDKFVARQAIHSIFEEGDYDEV